MEKLLHERLRECAERCVDEIDVNGVWIYPLTPTEFVALADEIERCYHPKPVDVDGRPWELGDECITAEGEDATIVGYRPGRRVFIDLHDVREFARCYASDLKRPLKVLDADGVEIKVGDAVYWTDETSDPGREAHVYGLGFIRDAPFSPVQVFTTKDCTLRSGWMMPKHLTHERPVLDANGERICEGDTCWYTDRLPVERFRGDKVTVKRIYENGITVYNETRGFSQYELSPESLTHREPDSLEKLRDDLMAAHESWDGDPNKLVGYADRLTALIERGA